MTRRLLPLLLVAVVAAGPQVREKWSWGQEESPSPGNAPSEGRSRSADFLFSNGDEKQRGEASVQRDLVLANAPSGSPLTQVAPPGSVAPTLSNPTVVPATLQTVSHSSGGIPVAPQVTGLQVKGETRGSRKLEGGPGDGQAQARFLDKFCDYGIGFGCNKKSHTGHHGIGTGISPYDVTYVQPVQVVAVGPHIPAIPVHKGPGHHKGHHKASYSPPAPAYHPPVAPSAGYGAPSYRPPASSYGAPASSYGAPVQSSYSAPKASPVVQHVHTHQHVYNGASGGGGYSYAKDNSLGGSNVHRSTTTFFDKKSTRGSSVNRFGSSSSFTKPLPIVPPRQTFLNPTTQSPLYLEDCDCVERHICSTFDIVGRSRQRTLPLLDARSKKTDILSNATSAEEQQSNDNEEDDEAFTASEAQEHVAARRRRSSVSAPIFANKNRAAFPTSRQRVNSYRPGLSGCASGHVCCRTSRFREQRQVSTCGRRSAVGLLGRVKNPHFQQGDTEFGEYPWQAAILKREGSDNVYVCGAVLIDRQHLLTAAHCIAALSPSSLKVRLGEWDVGRETEIYSHVEEDVAGVYSHPQYNPDNLNNDIAVLKLYNSVDLVSNPHISPVCLPDRFSVFSGQRCHATGWGKDAFGDSGDFQHILKEVDLPLVNHRSCENALRQTRLGRQFLLHEGMICAGGEEGKDACEGDGGSPLVCRDDDGLTRLAGLVSWGVGCGRRGVPGVYTNVPHYLNWIRSIARV